MKQVYAMFALSMLMLGCGETTKSSVDDDNAKKVPDVVGTDADGTLIVLKLPGMT
ncbi:MAG: hypothetical protein O3A00_18635 [Planctomycetota bacterium]|nr:hypothetical protein [Planctomycetota bacterium]